MSPDYYDILGLKRSATPDEVKSAYRKLAKEWHPDTNTDPKATDKFLAVQRAYEVLRDPEQRLKYDQLRDMQTGRVRVKAQPQPEPKPWKAPSYDEPRLPPEDLMRMTSLLRNGRYADAEKVAEKLVQAGPKNPLPYAVLGDVARYRGELKRASEMYAYAAQYDPASETYVRKQQECLRAMSRQAQTYAGAPEQVKAQPLFVAVFVVLVAACFVALSPQPPFLPRLELISTWTVGLFSMLILSGVTLGASLALAGLLDEFQVSHGSSIGRLPPSVILAIIAMFNFWAALGLYVLIGMSQQTFNRSTSMIVSCVAAVTSLFALSSAVTHQIAPMQTFLWGGNVVYLGVLGGWLVADAFREE